MASQAMKGKEYRALRRLSTLANVTVAAVGETCERVAPSSLPSLLASGKIERVTPAPKARPGRSKDRA